MEWLRQIIGRLLPEPPPAAEAPAGPARTWRLWQVEPARDCTLACLMCPWPGLRGRPGPTRMTEAVWKRLSPHLGEVGSVDFTGSGETLGNDRLLDWAAEAKLSGCSTGFLTNGVLLSPETSRRIVAAGVDWVGISIDGADKDTYEAIRRGADFEALCHNLETLSRARTDGLPYLMFNFVIMERNVGQLEEIVRLARNLGADHVNFKQCDVIRGRHGRGLGLFEAAPSRRTAGLQKNLDRARRLAARLGLRTTAFPFSPKEQPVCDQDPRTSLFIRCDGLAAPCINLAYGGASTFFGREVTMPEVVYGDLSQATPAQIWESEPCREFRRCFQEREERYLAALASADFGRDLAKFNEALAQAAASMNPAPDGCRSCHYLYGV